MQTIPAIQAREAAIYAAQRIIRAATPLSRSRILAKSQSACLVLRYVEALGRVDKARCQAEQERAADQIVSTEKQWPTMDQMREQAHEGLRKMLAAN